MKTLCFKIWGDFGHFRHFYTTTSPITYSLIPPTTIMGILGAILGLERKGESYYKTLQEAKTRVGIGVEEVIKKKNFGINLINTKNDYWVPTSRNSAGPRTPTRFEYVVNPKYQIYVTMEDEHLLDKLALMVKEHKSCYTISLGLSSLLADFSFIEYCETEHFVCNELIEISTAVPLSLINEKGDIGIIDGISYCKERYVKYFLEDRIPGEYVDVLFSQGDKKAYLKPAECYRTKNKYFTFIT